MMRMTAVEGELVVVVELEVEATALLSPLLQKNVENSKLSCLPPCSLSPLFL